MSHVSALWTSLSLQSPVVDNIEWPLRRHKPHRSNTSAATAKKCCASKSRTSKSPLSPHSGPLRKPQRRSASHPYLHLTIRQTTIGLPVPCKVYCTYPDTLCALDRALRSSGSGWRSCFMQVDCDVQNHSNEPGSFEPEQA